MLLRVKLIIVGTSSPELFPLHKYLLGAWSVLGRWLGAYLHASRFLPSPGFLPH